MTKFIRVNIQGYNGPTLINVDDVSMISEYGGRAYFTMRTMQQQPVYGTVSGGVQPAAYMPSTFQTQESLADIEIMLGLRTAPQPFPFSLDELNKAEDEINQCAAS